MKLLLFTAFVATISFVNAGKTARLLAAMNAGMLNGMIAGGLNPPLVAGGGVGLIGQPPFAQLVPGLPAFALRAPVPNMFPAAVNPFQVPVMGVPQMAQMNPPQQPQMVMAGGVMQQQPLMGMAGGAMPQQPLGMVGGAMQQPLGMVGGAMQQPMGMVGGAMQPQPQMGMAGGALQQQLPVQPDPLRRFRRQIMKSADAVKPSVDTQIPVPTESGTTKPPCDNTIYYQDN